MKLEEEERGRMAGVKLRGGNGMRLWEEEGAEGMSPRAAFPAIYT